MNMSVNKSSISLKASLAGDVRRAVQQAGQGVSAWLAEAAAAKLRAEALATFLDAWERKHDALSAQELRRAEAELGVTTQLVPH